ncbi:MAG: 4Fe-4S dicluster domain-containing protein [Bacteroidales bacterium]|nr:4Fe-4S dicluster domain-containing protein [Bacteroidales bacterium]
MKKIRVILAIILFALITLYFLDFANIIPKGVHFLAEIQFIPALLSGAFVVLLALLLLTLVLGRVYCSVICPMGVFQDVVSWMSKRFTRKKKYTFSKEKKILRYSLLAAVIIAFSVGGTILLSLLDPYSAFGRMTTHLFRPVYMAGNNLLADLFNHFENYTFYAVKITLLGILAPLTGLFTFLGIGFLAWKHGRTYCNTICPVGSILGFVSRFSFLKVRINDQACNTCGLCEMNCKASCIDSKNKTVDYSRCIDCYDCLNVCKKKALSYSFARKKKAETSVASDDSKRTFLTVIAGTALILPGSLYAKGLAKIKTNTAYTRKHPLSPPGSENVEHFLHHCTACHLCVAKCPSNVLKPAFMEYGLGGIMQPRMDFVQGYCNYDCTVCSEVCPNGAIKKLTMEEKHALQVGKVHFVKANCVVYTDETSCGACSEHCPTQAVKMVPYKNGLTIPSVDQDICVGCGGCEYICPARPYRAIYVEGNPVHLQAKKFQEDDKKEVQIENFGF